MTRRNAKKLTAATVACLVIASGCVSVNAKPSELGSRAPHAGCKMMTPPEPAPQTGTQPAMSKCKMMDAGAPGKEPDAASDAGAHEHHPEGSGPFSAELASFRAGSALPQAGPADRGQAQASQSKDAPAAMAGEVIVKFKDDGKVKDIINAFWKDPAAAKAKFDDLKRGRPEMAAASLARVTYSNELVLVFPIPASSAQATVALRQIADQLAAATDIAYAEPDMIVYTQH